MDQLPPDVPRLHIVRGSTEASSDMLNGILPPGTNEVCCCLQRLRLGGCVPLRRKPKHMLGKRRMIPRLCLCLSLSLSLCLSVSLSLSLSLSLFLSPQLRIRWRALSALERRQQRRCGFNRHCNRHECLARSLLHVEPGSPGAVWLSL